MVAIAGINLMVAIAGINSKNGCFGVYFRVGARELFCKSQCANYLQNGPYFAYLRPKFGLVNNARISGGDL